MCVINKYDYSIEKNEIIQAIRNVGFEDVIEAIKNGDLLDDIEHFNKKKYPGQRIFIVKIKTEVYAVPYIKDNNRKVIFLKTIYPSRKLKKKYCK